MIAHAHGHVHPYVRLCLRLCVRALCARERCALFARARGCMFRVRCGWARFGVFEYEPLPCVAHADVR